MENDTEIKQNYLRTEIIDKGYDAEEFTAYISSLKGEDGINLELWSMEELANIVIGFQKQQNNNHIIESQQFIKNSELHQIDKNEINHTVEINNQVRHNDEESHQSNKDNQEIQSNNFEEEKNFELLNSHNQNNQYIEDNRDEDNKDDIYQLDSNKKNDMEESISNKLYTNQETPNNEYYKIENDNVNQEIVDENKENENNNELPEVKNLQPPEPTGSLEDFIQYQNEEVSNKKEIEKR